MQVVIEPAIADNSASLELALADVRRAVAGIGSVTIDPAIKLPPGEMVLADALASLRLLDLLVPRAVLGNEAGIDDLRTL